MMKPAHAIFLQAQIDQQKHDLRAHRDILNLDTHTRIKHMTLHFLKYAGRLAEAQESQDLNILNRSLLDTFIICLATANTLNLNLGKSCPLHAESLSKLAESLHRQNSTSADIYNEALFSVVKISGKMAKAIESTDHLEKGDPRSSLEALVADLGLETLRLVGKANISIENDLMDRWKKVEEKSIFYGSPI